MVMYRAHCQRVLDSIVRATFDEVGESIQQLWLSSHGTKERFNLPPLVLKAILLSGSAFMLE